MLLLGNHDITLDPKFYADYGLYFHNQIPQDPRACMKAVINCESIMYLNHESVEIRLSKDGGPRTMFKVFGSPYSPANGCWAFGYPPEHASHLWDKIPLDTDIVVTHTPPKYHCDESKDRGAAGCEILRQTLWRVRPCLAICGHVHEGRGVERVTWDLECSNIKYKESDVQYWIDTGLDNKKQCLINLTSRGGAQLDNTGSFGKTGPSIDLEGQTRSSSIKSNGQWKRSSHPPSSSLPKHDTSTITSMNQDSRLIYKPSASQIADVCADTQLELTSDTQHISSAVRGQGGIPPSGRCDMEALSARMAKKETCVINAAMMASSWPHKANNMKRYNKPIVVDVDLPTWEN